MGNNPDDTKWINDRLPDQFGQVFGDVIVVDGGRSRHAMRTIGAGVPHHPGRKAQRKRERQARKAARKARRR